MMEQVIASVTVVCMKHLNVIFSSGAYIAADDIEVVLFLRRLSITSSVFWLNRPSPPKGRSSIIVLISSDSATEWTLGYLQSISV